MADIDVSSPGDSDVISSFPADERASRAALLALLSGTGFWGGTAGGSANAITVSVSNTGLTLTAGLTIHFLSSATVSDASATLQVNSLTPKTLVLPNGDAIYSATNTRAGIVTTKFYTVFYDGTRFIVLNPSNYMDQQTYNSLYPVNQAVQFSTNSSPQVPLGVAATWTLYSPTGGNRLLELTAGVTNTEAGSGNTTSSESSHTHSFSATTSASDNEDVQGGGGTGVAQSSHTHTVSGTTGAGSAHSHTIDPAVYRLNMYRRTA